MALEHPRIAVKRAYLRQEPEPVTACWDASMLLTVGDGSKPLQDVLASQRHGWDATSAGCCSRRPTSAPSSRKAVQTLRMSSYEHPRNSLGCKPPPHSLKSVAKSVVENRGAGLRSEISTFMSQSAGFRNTEISNSHLSRAGSAHDMLVAADSGALDKEKLTLCNAGWTTGTSEGQEAHRKNSGLVKTLLSQGWSCRMSQTESVSEQQITKAVLHFAFEKAMGNLVLGKKCMPLSCESNMLRVHDYSSDTCASSASAEDGSCAGVIYNDCEPITAKESMNNNEGIARQLIQEDSTGSSSQIDDHGRENMAVTSAFPLTTIDLQFGPGACDEKQVRAWLGQKQLRPASAGAYSQSSWSGGSNIGTRGFGMASVGGGGVDGGGGSGGFDSAKRPGSTRPWSAPPQQSRLSLTVTPSSMRTFAGAALRNKLRPRGDKTWIQPPRFVASRPASPSIARLLACAGGKSNNLLVPCSFLQPFSLTARMSAIRSNHQTIRTESVY